MSLENKENYPSLEAIAHTNELYGLIRGIEGIRRFKVWFTGGYSDEEKTQPEVYINLLIDVGDNGPIFKNKHIIDIGRLGVIESDINSHYLHLMKKVLEYFIKNYEK